MVLFACVEGGVLLCGSTVRSVIPHSLHDCIFVFLSRSCRDVTTSGTLPGLGIVEMVLRHMRVDTYKWMYHPLFPIHSQSVSTGPAVPRRSHNPQRSHSL